MPNATNREPEEESSGRPEFAFPSIARTLWKRKVVIISVWILLSLVAAAVVRELPAVYVAESLILVDSQRIPEKFVSATVAADLEQRITAIREQMLSSAALKQIISDFGLYRKERQTLFEEDIIELMRKDITIEFVETTLGAAKNAQPDAFRIGYQGRDPALVAKVANRLTDLCVDQNLKTREEQAAGTSEFLDTQVQEAKKRLDGLESAVSSYKLRHNGELPQQEAALSAGLSNLHSRLQANMDAIDRAQQTKIIEQSNLSAMQANEVQVRTLDQAGGSVAAASGAPPPRKLSEILQERLDMLRTQYIDTFPTVVNTRKALEAAKSEEEHQLAKKLAPGPNGEKAPDSPDLARTREQITALKAQIQVADAEIASRTAEQKQILRDIDSYQGRIEHLPLREQEMAQLTRDYETAKENYKSLLNKQTAAAMSLDMERRQQSERFTVLDRPTVPERPLKPKKPALYAGGSAAALVLGLLLGFVIELRKNVFLGEWELPEGTTVLARLPYIEVPVQSSKEAPRSRGKGLGRKKQLAAASSLMLCLAGVLATGIRSIFRPIVNIHV